MYVLQLVIVVSTRTRTQHDDSKRRSPHSYSSTWQPTCEDDRHALETPRSEQDGSVAKGYTTTVHSNNEGGRPYLGNAGLAAHPGRAHESLLVANRCGLVCSELPDPC